MRSGSKQRAAVVSIAIHSALGAALLSGGRKHAPMPVPAVAIQLEIVDQPPASIVLAPDAVGEVVAPATPVKRSLRKLPIRDPLTQEREAPPTPPTLEGGDRPIDRLWSLRRLSPLVQPLLLGKPNQEDPNALFGGSVPNVIKKTRQAGALATVEGRGDVKMMVGEDGRIERFTQPKARGGFVLLPGMIGFGGVFDATDELMRAVGKNPYRYEEHRLAEITREERLCQMMDAAKRDTREALFNLKQRLASLWHNPQVSVTQRRELLFELWDECLDDGTAASPGAMAKATIEAFIRETLPPSSAAAFTQVELALLNQRRTSVRPFAPYAAFNWRDSSPGP